MGLFDNLFGMNKPKDTAYSKPLLADRRGKPSGTQSDIGNEPAVNGQAQAIPAVIAGTTGGSSNTLIVSNLAFTEDELRTLKAFFEQLLGGHSDPKTTTFECSVKQNDTVFYYARLYSSGMGWHDESWHNNSKFTITKPSIGIAEGNADAAFSREGLIGSVAEQAEDCRVLERTCSEEFHYKNDTTVLLVKGFLGIPGPLRIEYSDIDGEW